MTTVEAVMCALEPCLKVMALDKFVRLCSSPLHFSVVFIDLEESTVTSVTDGVTLINTTVTCDFTSYPPANVTWFGSVDTNKDVMLGNDTELGTRVSTERPSLLAVNSTLVVEATGIIIRVTGPYICRASNGEETSTIGES